MWTSRLCLLTAALCVSAAGGDVVEAREQGGQWPVPLLTFGLTFIAEAQAGRRRLPEVAGPRGAGAVQRRSSGGGAGTRDGHGGAGDGGRQGARRSGAGAVAGRAGCRGRRGCGRGVSRNADHVRPGDVLLLGARPGVAVGKAEGFKESQVTVVIFLLLAFFV